MSRQDPPAPPSADLTALSESSFEQDVLDEQATHLVLFWASWSKDCMVMLEDMNRFIASQDQDLETLSVGSVDIEANAMLSIQYNIRTLPTLLVFHQGHIQEVHEGYLSEHMFKDVMTRISTLQA
jgi:thioredoxin 1